MKHEPPKRRHQGTEDRAAECGQSRAHDTPLRRWIVSFAGVALASAVAFQWLDRPIALLFHHTIASPEPFTKLTYVPDLLVPLAVVVFAALGLLNLSGHALSRLQTCAMLCSLSLVVAEITKSQLKFVFGRTWPNTWTENNSSFLRDGIYGFNFFHGGHGYASFPSGHGRHLRAPVTDPLAVEPEVQLDARNLKLVQRSNPRLEAKGEPKSDRHLELAQADVESKLKLQAEPELEPKREPLPEPQSQRELAESKKASDIL